jgi:hypothetical protein
MKELLGVLETYSCLIDTLTNFPGIKMEDLFSSQHGCLESLKKEKEWLLELLKKEEHK